MATLAAPFILCPLADSKELIGFSPDRKENTAIVTLGRNIAIRYLVRKLGFEINNNNRLLVRWFNFNFVFVY